VPNGNGTIEVGIPSLTNFRSPSRRLEAGFRCPEEFWQGRSRPLNRAKRFLAGKAIVVESPTVLQPITHAEIDNILAAPNPMMSKKSIFDYVTPITGPQKA
jgi:hypothetical protein